MSALQVLVREYGYLSLLITLFLDGSGLPWPTEATLVLAGLAVKAGHMTWLLSWGAALLGGTAGSALSYYLGARLGHDALRNLIGTLRMPVSTLDKVDAWFERHGDRAVFFARFIPFVRVLVGYPAGITGMDFRRYMLFSMAGYGLYIALTLGLGYAGLSLAHIIGDADLALSVFGTLFAVIAWFKWIRPRLKRRSGKL